MTFHFSIPLLALLSLIFPTVVVDFHFRFIYSPGPHPTPSLWCLSLSCFPPPRLPLSMRVSYPVATFLLRFYLYLHCICVEYQIVVRPSMFSWTSLPFPRTPRTERDCIAHLLPPSDEATESPKAISVYSTPPLFVLLPDIYSDAPVYPRLNCILICSLISFVYASRDCFPLESSTDTNREALHVTVLLQCNAEK